MKKIAIIGLGYVGLPIAVGFSKKGLEVYGFDSSQKRIDELKAGFDKTGEVSKQELENSKLILSNNASILKNANFFIVTVPTPIDEKKIPDLNCLYSACKSIGANLKKGDIVVFESTVYPGLTEEECVPWLEKYSNLKCGTDFKVGYSPERINPSDKEHTFENIVKVVSGMDEESLETIANTYALVVKAGVYRAPSIKVAEAAKVIENTQRDINIAFMNELSLIFNRMGIDTYDVLKAASTKWNFLNFTPGLVGGHCIGVDPYYLTHKALSYGYHTDVILSGRRINDSMGKYIATELIKTITKKGGDVSQEKILILGTTFKENCSDMRNSRVYDIYCELKDYGVNVNVYDSLSLKEDLEKYYQGQWLSSLDGKKFSAIIYAVPHRVFSDIKMDSLLLEKSIVFDLKGKLDIKGLKNKGHYVWRL